MSKTEPTQEQIDALADAMCCVLNDMGDDDADLSVCPYVKAKARVAFEPFRSEDDGELMDFEKAQVVIASAKG